MKRPAVVLARPASAKGKPSFKIEEMSSWWVKHSVKRNYVSNQYHAAKSAAKAVGYSPDEAKAFARTHYAKAVAKWDAFVA